MDIVIRHAILDLTGEEAEVGICNGKISVIQPSGVPTGRLELDAAGGMVSPALLELHFHLDKALLWRDHPNHSGTLQEAIKLYTGIKDKINPEDIDRRVGMAINAAVRNGVLWLRSHTDIDDAVSMRILDRLISVREQFRDRIGIDFVAFPQNGLTENPQAVELMWQAMEKGCNLVGGMPHCEKDLDAAARHIEIGFEIARHYNTPIDMHIDETDDPFWNTLELLADQTLQNGWQGRVCASHCCTMSAWNDSQAARVIEKLKRARITVISNPPVNLMLQGRRDHQPIRRGITRVKELMEAGVNVVCGQDDMFDMFYPFGRMDPLETALFMAHAAHLSSEAEIQAAFDMPRYRAAQAWGLGDYGIQVGHPANLIVIPEHTPVDALRMQSPRRWVIREGALLVENQCSTQWYI
jgi:cytosine deaminase